MSHTIWLELRIAFATWGWVRLATVTACLIAAALQWLVRPQILADTAAVVERHAVHADSGHATVNSVATRLQAFSERLITPGERGGAIKAIFAEAESAGIQISQADYQMLPETAGGFTKLQVTLPVKGTYPKIRAFLDGVLVALPALSLDEVNFRRESIKATVVEARIRLTLHLRAQE